MPARRELWATSASKLGAITETLQVSGEISQINLATAEKAGTISMTQLQNVAVKGRDMFAYMTTIPGIVDNMSQGRETTSPDSLRGTFINGSRENSKNYAVDGITNLDTGSNNTLQFEPNMDSIAEVKVLTSNFQAEYGRNGGGVITVITRGGGSDFHVSAYDTYRHESLNANSFWNNRTQRGQGSVPLPHHRLYRRRPRIHPEEVQHQARQAVLLLEPGVHGTAQRLRYETADHADRGGTRRRFLQERHQFRLADRDQRSAQRRAVPGQHRSQERASARWACPC